MGSSSAVTAAGEIMGKACSSAMTLCCVAAVGGGLGCAVSCLSSSQPASAEVSELHAHGFKYAVGPSSLKGGISPHPL